MRKKTEDISPRENAPLSEFLWAQCDRYPGLRTEDLVKALYQSVFGCGHFVTDEQSALAYMEEEAAGLMRDAPADTEPLWGRYARVHLTALRRRGIEARTLTRLFVLSSRQQGGSMETFLEALAQLEAMAECGLLPVESEEARRFLADYRARGCPALHHSEAFRTRYAPAYRVVDASYASLLGLFARIDQLRRERGRVLVALDGGSASGKTTLGALLEQVYAGAAVHMDDFFLQPHQRCEKRLAQPGGNVDYERFLEEVLTPMRRGEPFVYRRYDCHTQTIEAGERRIPADICVIEGAYSLHPALEAAMDLRVFLQIDAQRQSERILRRNGAAMRERFLREWIPLETRYFEETKIAQRCDMRLRVLDEDGGFAEERNE